MRKSVALLSLAGGLLCAGRAMAEDHLASPEAVRSRLDAAVAEREQGLATLDRFLSSPRAASAARILRADVGKVKASLAGLSDAEVQDLAARAETLTSDPVAGLDPDIRELLVIFLIVAIVILVLKAVD
jgi:hypothetical protein